MIHGDLHPELFCEALEIKYMPRSVSELARRDLIQSGEDGEGQKTGRYSIYETLIVSNGCSLSMGQFHDRDQ